MFEIKYEYVSKGNLRKKQNVKVKIDMSYKAGMKKVAKHGFLNLNQIFLATENHTLYEAMVKGCFPISVKGVSRRLS